MLLKNVSMLLTVQQKSIESTVVWTSFTFIVWTKIFETFF